MCRVQTYDPLIKSNRLHRCARFPFVADNLHNTLNILELFFAPFFGCFRALRLYSVSVVTYW